MARSTRKESKPYTVHVPDSIDWRGFEWFYERAHYLRSEALHGKKCNLGDEFRSTYRKLLRTLFNNRLMEDWVKYDYPPKPTFPKHAANIYFKITENEFRMLNFFESEGKVYQK